MYLSSFVSSLVKSIDISENVLERITFIRKPYIAWLDLIIEILKMADVDVALVGLNFAAEKLTDADLVSYEIRVGASLPKELTIYRQKGGLVFFQLSQDKLLRVELFGTEIESIAVVDMFSKKVIARFDAVEVPVKPLDQLYVGGRGRRFIRFATYDFNREYEKSVNMFDLGWQLLPDVKDSALKDLLQSFKMRGFKIYLLARNSFCKSLDGKFADLKTLIDDCLLSENVCINKGFVDNDRKFVILSEYELSDSVKVGIEGLLDFGVVKVGDYVVHEDHGVGIFGGLINKRGDLFVKVLYAEGDTLWVPFSHINKISKYSSWAKRPRVTRLNSGGWQRRRRIARRRVGLLAGDIIRSRAVRQSARASVVLSSGDLPDVKSFISSFEFRDTPDQQKVTEEILADMMKGSPMDRVLVGDVGFGKTEIAMRAAFATVVSKGQVLLLAPTTLLVAQHEVVFKKRFEKYSFVIRSISRYSSPKEVRSIVQGVKDGSIDILIGTHKLLSHQLEFKNLGLIIVDEEQKFGVKQKELIKKKKLTAHVLSMSATPIPRSLAMALNTIRDISIIATPPPGKLAVKNFFGIWNKDLIIKAVSNEIKRAGQVFYVHNRIADLQGIVLMLMQEFPKIRIEILHSRIPLTKQKSVLKDFLHRKIDVLVATTIVANGLDIHTVNTLIVDDASRYGLAQLYQLRGRVGRGSTQAYAYFLYRSLPGRALQRLDALMDNEHLGAGFDIAQRDLEIRGMGNLLGQEQSGVIEEVGVSLYMKMLREYIQKHAGLL